MMPNRICTIFSSFKGRLTTSPPLIIGGLTLLTAILGVIALALHHPSPPPASDPALSFQREADAISQRIVTCRERIGWIQGQTHEERAVVSWYGEDFRGKRRADGSLYDPDCNTVAHKTLPFGTAVCFEYNGRVLFGTVRDRGPYWLGRSWDISAGMARQLGLEREGVAEMTVTIIGKEGR